MLSTSPHLLRNIVYCLLLLVSACSQYPLQTDLPSSDLSDEPPPDLWQLKAKLGLRSPERNGSLSINWQQDAASYVIYVQAPLGQGAATLRGNEGQVLIEQAGKDPISSIYPKALIEKIFGWDLPIIDLAYWARGLSNPNRPIESIEYDELGNLAQLQQSGWELSFSRYRLQEQWRLPNKITATQNGIRLTLIIKEWVL